MRGCFLLGCCLLLAESSCSGATTRNDSAGAGSGGRSDSADPTTTIAPAGAGSAALQSPNGAGGEASSPASDSGGAGGEAAGGSGGRLGEAGAPPLLDCDCLSSPVSWRRDGGLVFLVPSSYVEPCSAFRHELNPLGDPPGKSCVSALPTGCDGALGVRDINQALQHPDVRAALEAAPVLYGLDPRALDGQVDHIEVDGKVIEIGSSCDEPECAIPEGVKSFGYILKVIAEHELDTDCHLPE
jgi:hypothetical protein